MNWKGCGRIVLTSSRAISSVNVELKTNISDISSVFIIIIIIIAVVDPDDDNGEDL
jgi:hypothetical protein